MPFNIKTVHLLDAAFARRQSLRKHTNALRLINARGDALDGLVLEQYNKHFMVQVFTPFWLKEMSCLADVLRERFEVDYLIVKDRTQSASANPQEMAFKTIIQKNNSRTEVTENGLCFEVDLNDTLNTGLFLDMRANRLLAGRACKDKRVLNCFSYTCSFGVYARAHGALEVVNVDVSKKILEKGKYNYSLNQLQAGPSEFIRADAVLYMEKALKKNNRFDIVILDPPSFARAENKVFSVEKDFFRLIKMAAGILNAKGSIFVSTNFSGISHAKLEKYVKEANPAGRFKAIKRLTQDKDFPGSGQMKESHLTALWANQLII